MFTKALILLLLGASFVLATPINSNSVDHMQDLLELTADSPGPAFLENNPYTKINYWTNLLEERQNELFDSNRKLVDPSFKNKVNGWLQTVGKKFEEYYQQEQLFGEIKTPPNPYVTELSNDKYNVLQKMYKEMKKDAKVAIAEKIIEYAIAKEKKKFGAKFNDWKEEAKKYIHFS